jgi:hypothetical protein
LMTGTHTEHITQLLLNETIRQFTWLRDER